MQFHSPMGKPVEIRLHNNANREGKARNILLVSARRSWSEENMSTLRYKWFLAYCMGLGLVRVVRVGDGNIRDHTPGACSVG